MGRLVPLVDGETLLILMSQFLLALDLSVVLEYYPRLP